MLFNKHKIINFLPVPYLLFIFFWILLCLFSFTQKDPNLTIYNYPVVINLVEFVNQFGYSQPLISTIIFSFLLISLFSSYLYLIFHQSLLQSKFIKRTIIILIFTGIFAYPFLSHDLFNYLFNAKMILVYQKSPYQFTALDFPHDLWTRFMHNTHVTTPYGPFWTYSTLIPLFFTIKSFTLSYFSIKLFVSLSYLLATYSIFKIAEKKFANPLKSTALFLLNPFILVESIINAHNDIMMMALFLFSFYIFSSKIKSPQKFILSFIIFLSSVFTKYASVILAPIYLFCLRFKLNFFTFGGLILLSTVFTRLDMLHAWYLLWGISLLFLSPYSKIIHFTILLSFFALIRYIPFIFNQNWFPAQHNLILILPIIIFPFIKARFLSNENK